MARIRQNITYSDTREELQVYKNVRRGASEDAFWDEDELVDYRPPRKKKRKRVPGCAGNEGGPHVYVWIPTNRFAWAYEIKVCCGCEKRAPWRSFRAKV